jgi:dienelactone hydrolase
LLALAAALPLLLPVPKLPTPSGPYAVGTFSTMLVDESREEIYSDQPGEPRRLMVQFWYPAQPAAGAQPGPWMDAMEIMGPAISRWLDLPPFFLDHLRLARTHSYPEAPLLPGTERFPVLLFSHGWSGFRQQNTYQVEELASHGYVIVAVQHTYGSMATVFPDGQVAPLNPDALPTGLSGEAYQKAANRLVTQWAQDLSFVLDTLEGLNAKDPSGRFTGRLDMENVGAFGHSTGGGAVIEFCSREPRCKAGLTMDAYMIPVSLSIVNQGALSQPFLFMFSERWPTERNTSLFNHLYTQLSTPAYQITLPGTDHYDFTDMPMLSPVAPWLGLKGPLKGSRVMQIVDGFSRAFFDTYLKGQPSPLLERPESAFPEVTFKRR